MKILEKIDPYKTPEVQKIRNTLVEVAGYTSIRAIAKETGLSINTLLRVTRLQPVRIQTLQKLYAWTKTKKDTSFETRLKNE